jgi:hypothetical protein
MLPIQILAAVVAHTFPLHAEIDCGLLALRAGTKYKFQITVESTNGKKAVGDVFIGAIATPKSAAEAIFFCLRGTIGATARWQGVIVTVIGFGGTPVRKVTFEFNDDGPKPIVRWVPRPK